MTAARRWCLSAMLTIGVFLVVLTVDGLTHANREIRSSFSDIMRIMIHIEGTLNIVWIADVRNDEGCAPHLVSNEVNRRPARSDHWASNFAIFDENDPIFMNFLSFIQHISVKTNPAYDDYYT